MQSVMIQPADLKQEEIIHSGWLHKMGGARGGRRNWKKRWFVLKTGCLFYYKSPNDSVLMGVMPLDASALYDHGGQYQSANEWKISGSCYTCQRTFGTFLRRHHCRRCGESFCQDHSSQIIPLPKYGFHSAVRVCDPCAAEASAEHEQFLRAAHAMKRGSIMSLFDDKKKNNTTSADIHRRFTLPSEFKPHMFALKNSDRELWIHTKSTVDRARWVSKISECLAARKSGTPQEAKQWEMDYKQLEFESKVAEGSFGDVFKGKLWGTKVAIKTLKQLDQTDDAILEDLKQEVKILSQLRHPNVVLYIGACTTPPNICIVTEWCTRGSLYDLLHDPKIQVTCKMMINMCLGISQGMNYLHCLEKPIIHRDLKSYNILIDQSFGVKVADFGLSFGFKRPVTESGKVDANAQDAPNDIYGTPEWMAPEVMQGEHYDEKIDVYSFGVMLTELLTRQKPFADQFRIRGYQDVFDQVLDNDAIPTIPAWSANFIKPLIVSCLSRETSRRPSFNDIILYLQEFLQLDEADFFLQFDFPRLMHFLQDQKYQFNALGAAEIAKLAFNEKFRKDAVVPGWAKSVVDEQVDGRSYSFSMIPKADLHAMLVRLADLVGSRRSLVQLSACRALTALQDLFASDSTVSREVTDLILSRNALKNICGVLTKESKTLHAAASALVMALVKCVSGAGIFSELSEVERKLLSEVLTTEVAKLHEAHRANDQQIQSCNTIDQKLAETITE